MKNIVVILFCILSLICSSCARKRVDTRSSGGGVQGMAEQQVGDAKVAKEASGGEPSADLHCYFQQQIENDDSFYSQGIQQLADQCKNGFSEVMCYGKSKDVVYLMCRVDEKFSKDCYIKDDGLKCNNELYPALQIGDIQIF